jgi:hypothetical protein
MKTKLIIFSFVVFLFSVEAHAAILFQDDFDGYKDSASNHGWQVSSAVSFPSNEGYNGSRGAKISYTVAGTPPYWFGWNGISSFNRPALHVRFYFRVAAGQGGSKFIKLFGKKDGVGYANTTFPLESGGSISGARYGSGSGTDNDTQAYNYLKGISTDQSVIFQKYSSGFTPDDKWHCFEIYMKYNTDNKRDGEYKIWIDGVLRMHTTNVKNRNNANTRAFASLQFANYTATSTSYVRPLWYDNIVVSDEYIGPIGFSSVDPPPSQSVTPSQVEGFKAE